MKKLKGTEEDAKLYREIIKQMEADLADTKAILAKLEDAIGTTAAPKKTRKPRTKKANGLSLPEPEAVEAFAN